MSHLNNFVHHNCQHHATKLRQSFSSLIQLEFFAIYFLEKVEAETDKHAA